MYLRSQHIRDRLLSPKLFQQCSAWGGILCPAFFFAAWISSGFLPPMKPSWSAERVLEHYRAHETGIKVGADLMLLSGMFYGTFTAAISGQMRRIPGLSYTVNAVQLCSGAFACLTFLVPAMNFAVAIYRIDRSPELTLMLNDMAWIFMVMPWPPFLAQNWAFAYAIFYDRRKKPLFPRWLGWFNLASPLIFSPSLGLVFVKRGPVAWNGVLAIWIPAIVFFLQFIANTVYLLVAISSDKDDLQVECDMAE